MNALLACVNFCRGAALHAGCRHKQPAALDMYFTIYIYILLLLNYFIYLPLS
jgi:hypothetical protein